MKEILKSYKFRVYPDEFQQNKLNQTFGCVRFVWNKMVENFNSYGTESFDPKMSESTIKKSGDFPWLSDVSAASLQQKRMDFVETKKQFFSKKRKKPIGRMKFKKRGNRDSYKLPNQKFKLNQDDKTIRLEKIGYIPVILDRNIPDDADYRSVTVSKTPTGNYFVSILVKINVDLLPTTRRSVGIDLGLKDLFILSNGQAVSNPKWFRKSQTKLKSSQKHLSRKKKGSTRYHKQRLKVAKCYEKTANQRKYFYQSFSSALVREFDLICMEDLNVSGMKKNRNLAKSISDAGWSNFVVMLKYKCDWYGKTFVQIDRFYCSSQICSSCGHKDGKKTLDIREWKCSNCDIEHDRDLNAAINILNKGFSDLTGQRTNFTSAESVDYKRGEDVRLDVHLDECIAASMKRLDKFINLS